MTDYAQTSRTLSAALSLEVPPIAVSIVKSVPPGVETFSGTVPAGCSFWQLAAKSVFATRPSDHERCAVGMHTHGMAIETDAQKEDLMVSLKVFNDLGYVRTDEVAGIPTLALGTESVVYGPLAQAPVPPDLVLVFASSAQGLIVTEAVQQLEGGVPPAMGRPACAIVPQAIGTGRAALSLGCCGARAYVDALAEPVALWALPGSRLDEYVERIDALAKANSVLTQFHQLRRRDVEAGEKPSVSESLARLQAAQA